MMDAVEKLLERDKPEKIASEWEVMPWIHKCNIREKTVSNWGGEFRDQTELWKCLKDCMQPSLFIDIWCCFHIF